MMQDHTLRIAIAAGITLCLTLGACQSTDGPAAAPPDPKVTGALNRAMIEWLNNAAIDNAILAQATLHPYHFQPHSDRLNDLGRRDLMVLANHHRRTSGVINLRRGDASEELYEARLASVVAFIADAGVALEMVRIEDGIPSGDGMPSARVVQIQEAMPAGTRSGSASGGVGFGG